MWGNTFGQGNSRSPPPLQHPIPTHPAYIPEPPETPVTGGLEPAGYMRFSSESQRPDPSTFAQQQTVPVPLQGQPGGHYGVPPGPMYGVQPGVPYGAQPMYGGGPGMPPPPPGVAMGNLPDMSMWGVDNATAQFGMQLGRTAVQAGQQYVTQNFGAWFLPTPLLKHQFNVSNSYVLSKLRLLLFPWRHKYWNRKVIRSDASNTPTVSSFFPPRDDINSPDLYIPSMAVVTYVLLLALGGGHPDILGGAASKSLSVLLVEFVIVKLGCYFLNVPGQSQVVDLIAYGGYKFVGSTVIVLVGLLNFSRSIYWLVFLYLFSANAFFLLRSLRTLVLHDPTANPANPYTPAQRSYRVIFLFTVALLQIPFMLTLAWV